MLTRASVCHRGGGGGPPPSLPGHTPPRTYTIPPDTPRTHFPSRYGQPAVGTHPIGMHSCFKTFHCVSTNTHLAIEYVVRERVMPAVNSTKLLSEKCPTLDRIQWQIKDFPEEDAPA